MEIVARLFISILQNISRSGGIIFSQSPKVVFLTNFTFPLSKVIYQVDRKKMATSLNKFYNKIKDGFCFNRRKHFLIVILFQDKQRDIMFLQKTILWIFTVDLRLKDWQVFM